jgi:8-oxo-dGTP pyrophosphatase MutT (NUDIX family)
MMRGEVLVVKGHQEKWELPGGGLDHSESVHDCLKRELFEELNITNDFTESFYKIETQHMPSRPDKELDFWKMSMYFDVKIIGDFTFTLSEDLTDARFMPDSVLNELYG